MTKKNLVLEAAKKIVVAEESPDFRVIAQQGRGVLVCSRLKDLDAHAAASHIKPGCVRAKPTERWDEYLTQGQCKVDKRNYHQIYWAGGAR